MNIVSLKELKIDSIHWGRRSSYSVQYFGLYNTAILISCALIRQEEEGHVHSSVGCYIE